MSVQSVPTTWTVCRAQLSPPVIGYRTNSGLCYCSRKYLLKNTFFTFIVLKLIKISFQLYNSNYFYASVILLEAVCLLSTYTS
jgi:hypothetical protein